MAGFIYKLQNVMKTSTTSKSSDAQIARFLLNNLHMADKHTTITDVANACFTSISSISRFCTNIGYENFTDMRADYIGVRAEYSDLKVDNSYMNQNSLESYIEKVSNSMIATNNINLVNDTDSLVRSIYQAESVYIFATHITGDIMSILQRAVLATDKFIELVDDKHQQIEIAKEAKAGDLFILVSMDGMLLMSKEITLPVVLSEASTVLITQNIKVKFSDQFDSVVALGNPDEPFTAKYKLLLFVDYFINKYFEYSEE